MAYLQENSSLTGGVALICVAWISRMMGRIWTGGQARAGMADDLHRLAETSPHLLEDIGIDLDAQPSDGHQPEWTRGL